MVKAGRMERQRRSAAVGQQGKEGASKLSLPLECCSLGAPRRRCTRLCTHPTAAKVAAPLRHLIKSAGQRQARALPAAQGGAGTAHEGRVASWQGGEVWEQGAGVQDRVVPLRMEGGTKDDVLPASRRVSKWRGF